MYVTFVGIHLLCICENLSTWKRGLLEKSRVHLGRNQCLSLKKSEPNVSFQKQLNTGFALAVKKKSQAYQKSFLH